MRSTFTAVSLPTILPFQAASRLGHSELGFETIDGYFVSLEEGESALRDGSAMLMGGLLVGFTAAGAGLLSDYVCVAAAQRGAVTAILDLLISLYGPDVLLGLCFTGKAYDYLVILTPL